MIMGIDLGEAKTGVALCSSKLAEPYLVIKHKSQEELIKKLNEIIEKEKVKEIIVGISEGKMAEKQKAFGMLLAIETGLLVEFGDETLTSVDAQKKAIEAGKGRKKRAEMEDAYAAALMLQGWVDKNL